MSLLSINQIELNRLYNNNSNNKRSLLVQLKETRHAYKYQKEKTDGRGSTAYNRLIHYYIEKHITAIKWQIQLKIFC